MKKDDTVLSINKTT